MKAICRLNSNRCHFNRLMDHHAPVLLDEVLEALNIKAGGVYFDGTFGRGGHSESILNALDENGVLIAIDRDQDAIDAGEEYFADEPRLRLIKSDFAQLGTVIKQQTPAGTVDGILLDLGVSSPQLDRPERGFSFRADGPLDMRMDASQGISAREWLASVEQKELRRVIKTLGEERQAHRIAQAIVAYRETEALETTAQLAELVAETVPRKPMQRIHPATKTFQAIRIFINQELEQLASALEQALESLSAGGRLAVISFHSLEDRIVKRFMRKFSKSDVMYSGMQNIPDEAKAQLKLIGRQVRAGDAELERNPRARSAVLRVAERLPA